jgi:hypothetical protein
MEVRRVLGVGGVPAADTSAFEGDETLRPAWTSG